MTALRWVDKILGLFLIH